ncbi:hypothetical protein JTB14_013900 [Gonioctena quinquepunctata]|nr:hypothetical protein JTB14_013900 [Gonioctena quinquepunctata]
MVDGEQSIEWNGNHFSSVPRNQIKVSQEAFQIIEYTNSKLKDNILQRQYNRNKKLVEEGKVSLKYDDNGKNDLNSEEGRNKKWRINKNKTRNGTWIVRRMLEAGKLEGITLELDSFGDVTGDPLRRQWNNESNELYRILFRKGKAGAVGDIFYARMCEICKKIIFKDS